MPTQRHRIFRAVWQSVNVLLLAALLASLYSAGWEFSVRRYLDGFSDAIVPDSAPPERQVEAILDWMRRGPPRPVVADPSSLPGRDPETTLNYQQLLSVCGTASNAFLNLARSNGLSARRLLLLSPDRTAKHVVAEVLIDGRWVIADPAYRILLRDAKGHLLTREQLRDPAVFAQATSAVPHYPQEYNYESFVHVRLSRLPMHGFHLRWLLGKILPGWEERFDWTLLLERESFFTLCASFFALAALLLLRGLLGWYADHRLKIPCFRLRAQLIRARMTFFRAPEIK
ncbi:MAG TPA: transglutaminase domain-containing protein [Candidatus Acidoferrum sp.]|nr:transglutaminase domain-containing protein [Candidatus Acidoferrum sp.]